jgi:hypothetical protein
MIKKRYILFICLLIALLLLMVLLVVVPIFKFLTGPEYDSGLGSAQWTISDVLNEYYNKNGKYPAKLMELPLLFDDEAFSCLEVSDSNEILKYFTYKATDTTYELDIDYSRATAPKIEKEFGEKGQIVAFEYIYINSNRRERYEYPNGLHKNPVIEKQYQNNKLISETNYPQYFD